MTKKTRAKTRRALLALSLVMVTMLVTVGGTIAWLTANTNTITNTFSPSNIEVTLTETTGSTYHIVPGHNIAKNPTVTANSDVPYYVFVKVTKANWPTWENVDQKLSYSIDNAWRLVSGQTDVYYIAVDEGALAETSVLADNTVVVSNQITKAELAQLTAANPTVSLTAYAIQQEGFADAAAAWAQVLLTYPN